MFWWKNRMHVLMDKDGGDGGGSGSGGDGGGGNKSGQQNDGGQSNKPDHEAIARENAELKAKLAQLEAGNKDKDLRDRANDFRADKDKESSDHRAIESAVAFNYQKDEFLKKNAALLPESIKDLFTVADKHTYDSPVQKASEIKSGIIEEFFGVQANHDLLTASQKAALADYTKLTKDKKRENAQKIYDSIFEPTLEMLKAVKKADQVNRARNGYGDDSDSAYKEKLKTLSRQHYLGEKQNGT